MRTLIQNTTIITQDPERRVLFGANISIDGTKIELIGQEISSDGYDSVIDASKYWVMPGLINLHVHLGETIYGPLVYRQGSLEKYLETTEEIAEKAPHVESQRQSIIEYSTLQHLLQGTTTLVGGRTYDATKKLRVRSFSGYMLMLSKKLGRYTSNFKDKYKTILETQTNELTKPALFIHSLHSIDESLLKDVKHIVSENKGTVLMIHVAENFDVANKVKEHFKMSEIELLDSYSLLNKRTLVVHGNYLTNEDMDILKERGSTLVHCLSSNMTVAEKTLDVKAALSKDINFTIATDGFVSSGDYSLYREGRLAYYYHNRFEDEEILSPQHIVDAYTINAAKALGLDYTIGSIEVGKEADLVIIEGPLHSKCIRPIEALAMYGNDIKVKDVFIAGSPVVQNNNLVTCSGDEIVNSYIKAVEQVKDDLGL